MDMSNDSYNTVDASVDQSSKGDAATATLTDEMLKKLLQIHEAEILCNQTVLNQPSPSDGRMYCPPVFDGWGCWNYTLAGTTAYEKCPQFLLTAGPPKGMAFKICQQNGQWWHHPETNMPWSNYSQCAQETAIDLKAVLYVYYSGFALSIFFTLLALGIFTYFKQLHCSRVTVHKNLFVTYILSSAAWILMFVLSAEDPNVHEENPTWCQALHVITSYLTLCNFAWMFCEGFYLHTIIVLTFTNDKKLLIFCYIIGWFVPLLPTAFYAGFRGSQPEWRAQCWSSVKTDTMWFLYSFIMLSLLVNLIFLINILRILLSKLRAVNTNETHQTRRTVRATLILIPLLGLHYLLTPVQAEEGTIAYQVTTYLSAILTSYQGFFVALLFCFFNGEVIGIMRRKWSQVRAHFTHKDLMRSNTYNQTSLMETTYVPKSTNSSCYQECSSAEQEYDEVGLKEPMTIQQKKQGDLNSNV